MRQLILCIKKSQSLRRKKVIQSQAEYEKRTIHQSVHGFRVQEAVRRGSQQRPKNEHLPYFGERKAIFDIYCENEAGEKFIVEIQKVKQNFFKDRTVYYSTFPIQEQAVQGDWNFRLQSVYTVGILDFVFDDRDKARTVVSEVKLMDTEKKTVFYDKLTFIYLQMPNFGKTEDELETHFDKWLFVIKNLHRLQDRPAKLQERVFEKLFGLAEIEKFGYEERMAYEDSLKVYRDLKNSLDTAREEGEKMKALQIATTFGKNIKIYRIVIRGN